MLDEKEQHPDLILNEILDRYMDEIKTDLGVLEARLNVA